jgi:hypothetical protein
LHGSGEPAGSPGARATGLSSSTYLHGVKAAGRVVQVRVTGGSQVGGGLRGICEGWSDGSRKRYWRELNAREWPKCCLEVTLTYPGGDWPRSGRVCKLQLKAFRMRWERRWGPLRATWKLEFQRRGAPHFHLAVEAPEGVTEAELQVWVAQTWFEIVGSGEATHLQAGTRVKRAVMKGGYAAYLAGYTSKAKEFQGEQPAGFAEVGRWWGFWKWAALWVEQADVPVAAANRVRRALQGVMRARGGQAPTHRRSAGVVLVSWSDGRLLRRQVGELLGDADLMGGASDGD